jgi:hypothetical protein
MSAFGTKQTIPVECALDSGQFQAGASSVVKNGLVAAAKKKAGKLNGPCYRSCVKTSMGDAFRTDQFCAYSCSY